MVLLRIDTRTGGFGKKNRRNGDHPNYRIIEIGQNTGKSPGDLRRLAVTRNSRERTSANADVKISKEVI